MKSNVRVLGIDDAPFSFDDDEVLVVGAMTRGPSYLEAVTGTHVAVDGTDATERLVAMVGGSRYRENLHAVLLDGAALGGFNVVDLRALHEATGVPVVTVTREAPDLEAMRSTLQDKFDDWQDRWELLDQAELFEVATDHEPVHVKAVGIDPDEVQALLSTFTVRGALPEPIRIAHLVAAGVATGESHGRA